MNQQPATIDAAANYLIDPGELKRRIEKSQDLILLPAAATDALQLANDPNCSVAKFVDVIETDVGLVADILAMSNSAVYGVRAEITSVQHAVVTIGTNRCQNLIVSSCLKALSNKLPPSVEWSRDVLWRHNTHAATVARHLNKALKLGFEGEEFSGAMIHDMGRLLIAAAAPDVFDAVDRLSFCEDARIIEHERLLIGTSHCEVGGDFAASSGLPQPLIDVVRFHHTPEEAGDNSLLVHLIAAADHIANHLMFDGEAEDYDSSTNPSIDALMDASGRSDGSTIISDAFQLAAQMDAKLPHDA